MDYKIMPRTQKTIRILFLLLWIAVAAMPIYGVVDAYITSQKREERVGAYLEELLAIERSQFDPAYKSKAYLDFVYSKMELAYELEKQNYPNFLIDRINNHLAAGYDNKEPLQKVVLIEALNSLCDRYLRPLDLKSSRFGENYSQATAIIEKTAKGWFDIVPNLYQSADTLELPHKNRTGSAFCLTV